MGELEKFGIKKVIVIDDNYLSGNFSLQDIKKEDLSAISRQLEEFTDEITLIDYIHDNSNGSLDDFYQKNDLNQEEKQDVFSIITTFNNSVDRYRYLKEDVGEANIYAFNPQKKEDLESLKEEIVSESSCTFVVLDKKLDENNTENSKQLLKEALHIISKAIEDNKSLFMVMFSTEVPDGLKNYEAVRKNLADMVGITVKDSYYDQLINTEFPLHINFVEKNSKDVIEDFKIALRRSQKAVFTTLFEDSFTMSMNKLKEKVWELGNNESLFYYDYLSEGQHVDNIIYEIFETNFKLEYNRFKINKYDNVINPMRKSIQIFENSQDNIMNSDDTRNVYVSILRVIKDVYHLYKDTDDLLNVSKSDDISYGDVVSINQNKYIVISQDCDLVIRHTGKRKLSNITLLKLRSQKNKLPKRIRTILEEESSRLKKTPNEMIREMNLLPEGRTCLKNIGINIESDNFIKYVRSAIDDSKEELKLYNSIFCNVTNPKKRNIDVLDETSPIINMESFWMDALLLRTENDNKVIVTEETISDSKELRSPTKKKILEDFKLQLDRFKIFEVEGATDPEVIKKIFSQKFLNPLLEIVPIFSENVLKGFEINNFMRMGHMTFIETQEFHKKMISKQTRVAEKSENIL